MATRKTTGGREVSPVTKRKTGTAAGARKQGTAASRPKASMIQPVEERPKIVDTKRSLLALGFLVVVAFLALLWRQGSADVNALIDAAREDMKNGRYERAIDRLDDAARALADLRKQLEEKSSGPDDEARLRGMDELARRLDEMRREALQGKDDSAKGGDPAARVRRLMRRAEDDEKIGLSQRALDKLDLALDILDAPGGSGLRDADAEKFRQDIAARRTRLAERIKADDSSKRNDLRGRDERPDRDEVRLSPRDRELLRRLEADTRKDDKKPASDDPRDAARKLVREGRQQLLQNRNSPARDTFSKALDKDERNPDAWSGRSTANLRLSRMGDALSDAERALALSPTDAGAHMTKAEVAFSRDQLDSALDSYRKVVQYDPENMMAWYRLGYIYYRRGAYQLARDAFARTVAIDRNFAKAWFNLGLSHEQLGNAASAITAYTRAMQAQRGYDKPAFNLGRLY